MKIKEIVTIFFLFISFALNSEEPILLEPKGIEKERNEASITELEKRYQLYSQDNINVLFANIESEMDRRRALIILTQSIIADPNIPYYKHMNSFEKEIKYEELRLKKNSNSSDLRWIIILNTIIDNENNAKKYLNKYLVHLNSKKSDLSKNADKFTKQELIHIDNEIYSITAQYYILKYCKNGFKTNKPIPKELYKIRDNLREQYLAYYNAYHVNSGFIYFRLLLILNDRTGIIEFINTQKNIKLKSNSLFYSKELTMILKKWALAHNSWFRKNDFRDRLIKEFDELISLRPSCDYIDKFNDKCVKID
jgi:hypothetical protein